MLGSVDLSRPSIKKYYMEADNKERQMTVSQQKKQQLKLKASGSAVNYHKLQQPSPADRLGLRFKVPPRELSYWLLD